MPRLATGTTWQGDPIVIYDRVEGLDGDNITQASVASAFVRCFWDSSGEQIGDDLALDVSDVVFDTLQSNSDDGRYPDTGEGFNFRATIPGSYFRPLANSGNDDALVTVFVFFVDTETPPNVSKLGWQITAKQVFGAFVS